MSRNSATKRSSKQIKTVLTKIVNLAEADSEEEDLIEAGSEEEVPIEAEEVEEVLIEAEEVALVLITKNLLRQLTQKMETLKL